jgi:hypothetical protein
MPIGDIVYYKESFQNATFEIFSRVLVLIYSCIDCTLCSLCGGAGGLSPP